MRFLGLGKKKEEKKPEGPQLAPYECPFRLSGEIVQNDNWLYLTATQDDFLKFRTLADEMDGYVLRVAKDSTLVWDKKVKGEPMVLIKAFTVIENCPPERLWDVLHDPNYRCVWDDSRLESYQVSKLGDNCDIGYYGAKAQKPVYNRDFLNQRSWLTVGGGEYCIFNTSVPHEKCPSQKGFVRAISKISGYLIRPWGNGGCTLTYVSNADPKGWIPHAFVNMIVSKFSPAMLAKIRKAADDWPKWQASQANWKKTWEQDPTPWPVAQPNKTHDVFVARSSGDGASPVPEEDTDEDVRLDENGNEIPPEGAEVAVPDSPSSG